MPSSREKICNMALGHLGILNGIQNLDSDSSSEAQACRLWYYQLGEEMLRDFPYPFTTVFATLALVTDFTLATPTIINPEWRFSYRLPANCLMVRRIASGKRTDSRQSRVPYRVVSDANGELIYTDKINAQVEYTMNLNDAQYFSADFAMALSLGMAIAMVPALAAGDPYGLGARAAKMYIPALTKAQANAANEEQPDHNVEAEFQRARTGRLDDDHRGNPWSATPAAQNIE